MDLFPTLLLSFALLAVVYFVVTSILIFHDLQKRGQHPSFLLLRLYIPRYADDYRRLTRSETGHTGPLFFHWIISINAALVAVIAAGVIHVLQA